MTSSDVAHFPLHSEIVPGVGIGPWLVRERRDRGSYGIIFRVERAGHPEAGSFALKLALHVEDPRFPREVFLLQRTVHPSVPHFEDRGWYTAPSGRVYPYIVMEWVEGTSLYEWARQHKPSSSQVLKMFSQLAGALAVAHGAGGIHRDVKGGNVVVTAEGRAVLLDWGCGTYEGAKELTDTTLPPGTFSYRAPEALRWSWAHRKTGEAYEAGPADDIYSLGVMAYRLCTGTYPPLPTEGPEPQRRFLPPSELAIVSVGLERILLICLSEARKVRPSAASLVSMCVAAAKEPDAARPIVPTPAAAETEQASRPGPPRRLVVPIWLSAGVAAAAGAMLAVAASELLRRGLVSPAPQERAPDIAEHLREPPSSEVPDGGVGEEALASVVTVPPVGVPTFVLGLPMPRQPFAGQKKPPCAPELQQAINGGCWVGPLGTKKPPCGSEAFDYDDGCYMPVYNKPPVPTSDEPR